MGLGATLEIGKSGLKVYQVAAEVVSENIANVNTPGYSRQRVLIENAPPTTANGFPLGTGVRISTVERYYDALLQKQLVNAGTTSGYDEKKAAILQQVEPVFNEIAQDGLGDAITGFFNSWQDLTLNPAGLAERQSVISQGKILADQFNYTSRTLTSAISEQDQSLIPLVGDATHEGTLSSMLSDIAGLNGQIKITELVSGNANEMRDQRDYMVRQLAEYIGINYTENVDGTTDITTTIGGTTYALVTGSIAGSFSSQVTAGKNEILLQEAGAAASVAIYPATGQLGAILDMRDTVLQGYLDEVDALAVSIVTDVDTQHQLGFALNSAAQSTDPFFAATSTSAATIVVNPALTPALIAASGVASTNGNNANALAIAKLNGLNGYSDTYDVLVAQIGVDVQASQSKVSQDSAFMKQLTTLRDSNSGVSLDEELATLIQYQRSYQASAKLITTAGEMLDTVINMVQ